MSETLANAAASQVKFVASAGPNHHISVRPGAQATFVAFGTDASTTAEAAATGRMNLVRFLDEEHQFTYGVPGFLDSLDALFCWLRDAPGDVPLRLIGEGAGGSLALLGGLIRPDATFLAINPVLTPPWEEAEGAPPRHPFWGNVPAIAAAYPARQQGITILSAWEPEAAAVLGDEDAQLPGYGTIVALPGRGSGVAHLRRVGALAALLERGADGLRSLQESKLLDVPAAYGSVKQFRAFHEAHLALSFGGKEALRAAIREVDREAEWANPGWQHMRAMLLRREKRMEEALAAARQAVGAAPEIVEFCVAFARLVQETDSAEDRAPAAALLEPFLYRRGLAALQESLLNPHAPKSKAEVDAELEAEIKAAPSR